MAEKTFDGVSLSGQNKKECTVFLQLGQMQTTKKFMKFKPKNTELPSPTVSPDLVTVTAILNVDGNPVTYKWEKNHNGKIAKCVVKPEEKQLAVTLTKSAPGDWVGAFLDYLQEI